MPTHYLYGTILTGEAVAANNRGDNIGNTTTLQKVFHQDDVHTSVSAEAIRFALRYRFQLQDNEAVNRTYDATLGKLDYRDEKRTYWSDVLAGKKPPRIDDDLMGFMDAAAPKAESEDVQQDRQLIVYYFHGDKRCMTCHKLENYTKEALDTYLQDKIFY